MLHDLSEIKGNENVKRALEIAILRKHRVNIIKLNGYGSSSLVNCFDIISKELHGHPCFIDVSYKPNKEVEINVEMRKIDLEVYFSTRKSETNEDVLNRLSKALEFPLPSLDSIDAGGMALLKNASMKLNLTFKAINNVLLVAQTIAQADFSNKIQAIHLAEAIQYSYHEEEE